MARTTTTAYNGVGSAKFDTTAAYQDFYNSSFIPSSAGKTYTASVMLKGTGSVRFVISAVPSYAAFATIDVPLTSDWRRYNITGTTIAGTTAIYPVIYQASAGNQTAYIDSFMLNEGTTAYNFSDGSYTDWAWSGATNNSSSTGPVLQLNMPGTYPSLSITSSPLIKTTLPDADLNSFITPGKTDPYTTFIAATNNVQSATGVLPQPTKDQYVYQPIDSDGNLCFDYDCRKFNLYYRLERDNTVYMITSKNQ